MKTLSLITPGLLAICLTPIATAATFPTVVQADSPLSYYRFGDTGSTAADSGSANNAGTANGNADLDSSTAMRPPTFLGFTSANDSLGLDGNGDYVDLGNSFFSDLNGASAVTVAAWVNLDASDDNTIFHTTSNTTNRGGAGILLEIEANGIRYNSRSTSGDGNQNNFTSFEGIKNATDGTDGADTTEGFQAGEWHQVVAIWDYANDTASLYVDGEFINSNSNAGWGQPSFQLSAGTDGVSTIGSFAAASYGGFFDGNIDELAVYRKALSATEIKEHYDAAFVPEPGSMVLVSLGGLCLLARRRK